MFYHMECCNIPCDLFGTAKRFCDLIGWKCEACRLADVEEIANLRKELVSLHSVVHSLQQTIGTNHVLPVASSSSSLTQPSVGSRISNGRTQRAVVSNSIGAQ